MVFKLREFNRIIAFIQKRFLCRYFTREAKLEILDNCWNKLWGKLVNGGGTKKQMDIIIKINQVSPKIRRVALEEFLRCA